MLNQSVTKDWVQSLTFRMQSVLLSALRGYDMAKKDDTSKFITRSIRSLVLNNADPTNTFITSDFPEEKIATQFLWDIDAYPMHFIMHTTHAIEIIGYKHPDEKIKNWYQDYYQKLCKGFHLNFETENQLDVRLGSTEAEQKVRSERSKSLGSVFDKILKERKKILTKKPTTKPAKKKESWDAGTGTSHGGRGRPYSGSS